MLQPRQHILPHYATNAIPILSIHSSALYNSHLLTYNNYDDRGQRVTTKETTSEVSSHYY